MPSTIVWTLLKIVEPGATGSFTSVFCIHFSTGIPLATMERESSSFRFLGNRRTDGEKVYDLLVSFQFSGLTMILYDFMSPGMINAEDLSLLNLKAEMVQSLGLFCSRKSPAKISLPANSGSCAIPATSIEYLLRFSAEGSPCGGFPCADG